MNFDTISSQVGKYETNAEASPVSAQLQTLIAKHGLDVFKDIKLLNQEIGELQLSETLKSQLTLIFSSSTLPDFILNSKSDLNMVDVDNAIHNVVTSTGLVYKVALSLIADVFYACGLKFAIEYGPQLCGSTIEYKIHAMMSSKLAKTEIKNAERLIATYSNLVGKDKKKKDDEDVKKAAAEAVRAICKLCDAGVPIGFYMLGRCYLYGDCGTEPDSQKALEIMKIAAEHGVTEAAAALGDIYYEPLKVVCTTNYPDNYTPEYLHNLPLRDYTLAHHYYTRPGAMAMGKDRQRALHDIYKQYSANKTTLVFSGIVLVLTIAFLVFFQQGIFSKANRLAVGILFTVISGLAYAVSIWYNTRKPFNGIRWIVAVQYFIWALYAFVLLLA
jgi:hypothetical protein